MASDLERIITELENLTARLLGATCWAQSGEFGELLASRGALCARLMDRRDLDARAVARIGVIIQSGQRLVAPIMAMRQSVLDSLAETEAQRRFSHGLGDTLASQVEIHHLDLDA